MISTPNFSYLLKVGINASCPGQAVWGVCWPVSATESRASYFCASAERWRTQAPGSLTSRLMRTSPGTKAINQPLFTEDSRPRDCFRRTRSLSTGWLYRDTSNVDATAVYSAQKLRQPKLNISTQRCHWEWHTREARLLNSPSNKKSQPTQK